MSHLINEACDRLGQRARASGAPGQSAAREAPSRRSAAEPRLIYRWINSAVNSICAPVVAKWPCRHR
jgi:hypothetical protein